MLFSKILNKTITNQNVRLYCTKHRFLFTNTNVKFNLTPKRNLTFKIFRKQTAEQLKSLDQIAKGYELIYRSTMNRYLYGAQIIATITTIIFGTIAVFKFDPSLEYKITYDFELTNMKNLPAQYIMFLIGFLLFNFGLVMIVSRFPIRIYYNNELKHYQGILLGKLPNTKTRIEFKVGDVKHEPKQTQIIPWNDHRYRLENKKVIYLMDHYFRKPNDMNIMLGHVKPEQL